MQNNKVKHHRKKEQSALKQYIKQTERNRRREYESFLEKASESLQIPKDVLALVPDIRMSGNRSMVISGTYHMEEYRTEQIVLQAKKCRMTVQGNHLTVEYFRMDEIKIVGNILCISFG